MKEIEANKDQSVQYSMSNMFSSCSSLTSIQDWNLEGITNISNMFSSCSSLTSINWGIDRKVSRKKAIDNIFSKKGIV